MTNDQKVNQVKSLYDSGWKKWKGKEQEYEILDFSTTWNGQFAFGRFDVSEMIVVRLAPSDILAAAKWLNIIEAYYEETLQVVIDWDEKFVDFSDWYNDNIDERIISHAIFLEITHKLDKISELNEEIGKVAKLNFNEVAA